ncbi:ABC transporter permease [Staphylococcus massiliensis]|uniref:Sodium ABC transporter permease n=1 Tax=Staphylococcus massiliensis S46 TaxID=1229783 RepID=K9ANQ5_9STAP|nr:ABC transporter permease [Staphylococcus massiliensis]EKU49018.1 sodium ABC transporter permease [Staphylococcus massiliensis S46]MCG3399461.1 ABC transporter permease [Staphylococcus massiliensis]MCG3402440.1 ABC transporter permease [Staphylococcus massiliensis]MCG3411597.1 ABC transporter permease [Staphylococcus massiliensis]PNZ99493.1 ABC transporter permease [Staphylococcus massiliensis CCUG 55927]
MSKFLATFKLTYIKKIKTKSFVLMTLLMMVLILVGANIDKIIKAFNPGMGEVGIVTQDKDLYKQLKAAEEKIDDNAKIQYVNSAEAAKEKVKDKDLDTAYIIEETKDHALKGTIVGRQNADPGDKAKLQGILTTFQQQRMSQSLNIKPDKMQKLLSQSQVDDLKVSEDDKETERDSSESFFITGFVYVIVFLMFFIIINYASQIGMEVANEKTSRVIEMVITSVSPIAHVLSKILAIIAVAFTQLLLIVATMVFSYFVFDLSSLFETLDLKVGPDAVKVMIYGVIFFILGIISFIFLAAMLGAMTARIEDVGQAIAPMTLIQVGAFYIVMFNLATPNSLIAKITSFIPLFSPYVMFLRSSSPDTPFWHVLVGMIISLITIAVLMFLTMKVYKDAVLSFDKGLFASIKRLWKNKNA